MSKSLGNYIGITEPAKDMFGKLMSISDELMWRYYELLSSKSMAEIEKMKEQVSKGELHPKKCKEELALEITARYHGVEAARKELEAFNLVFAKGNIPEDIPDI